MNSLIKKKTKLNIPLAFDRKSSIIDQGVSRRKDASPQTNRSHSSDRTFSSPAQNNKKGGEEPMHPFFEQQQEMHPKLKCECAVCQNKLNETKNEPDLVLDSFFSEEGKVEKPIEIHHEMEKLTLIRNPSQFSGLKASSTNNDHDIMDKDFLFILKRLVPPKNSPYSLRVFIPDTVVFWNGEAKFLVYNGKDDFLKCVRQKEKLTLNEIKEFFLDRRAKRDRQLLLIQESILLSLIGLSSPRRSTHGKTNSQNRKSNMRVSLLGEDAGPESVDGLDLKKIQESMKIVFDSNLINSRSFNENLIRNGSTRVKMLFSRNSPLLVTRIVKNNLRIMSEMEFLNLMTKRRIEKALHDVIYLQAYIKPKKGFDKLFRVKFIYEREKHNELYLRAMKEICFLTNLKPQQDDNPPGFMGRESLNFEVELKKGDIFEYATYTTYKIVHFIEAFYGIKTTKLIAEYMKDDFNNLWLVNCCRVKYMDVNSIQNEDTYLKKVSLIDQEQKNQLEKQLDDFYAKAPKHQKKKIDKISKELMGKYDKAKEDLGINLNAESPQDSFSDNVFKNLNPNNPFTLTEILQNSHKPTLKRYVLQNFPENLIKYEKECYDEEARDNKAPTKQRPFSHKTKASDMTKSTNFTNSNRNTKFGVDYEKKSKKQEKFLQLCHNGFNQPKNIDYKNLLGEFSNFRRETSESNVPIKIKNNFEMKKLKEKPKTFQLKNNFFKEAKDIETNAIELTKRGLKNLEMTLPYLLYHRANPKK